MFHSFKMHFSTLHVLAICLVFGIVHALEVNQCGDHPLPSEINISNCTEMPCPLIRGTTMHVGMEFYAPYYIEQLSPKAVAYALGVNVTYPLADSDGCESLTNTRCPLEEGEYTKYDLPMPVSTIYPQISLSIFFYLVDQNDVIVTCMYVDCKVV